MELFSIQCDSCGSRLKVRKMSAIGQILTCPKCSSMVQVTPPDGWEPPQAASQARPKTTQNQAGADRAVPADAAPANAAAGNAAPGSAALGSDFDDIGQLVDDVESGRAAAPTSAVPPPSDAHSSESMGMAVPDSAAGGESGNLHAQKAVLPNDEWVSNEQRSRQKLTLTIAASIGALLIAAVMITYLIVQLGRSTDAQLSESDAGDEAAANATGDTDADDTTANDQASDTDTVDSTQIDDGTADTDTTNDADQTNDGAAPGTGDPTTPDPSNPDSSNPETGDPDGTGGAEIEPTELDPPTAPPGFGGDETDRGSPDNIGNLIIGDLEALGEMMEPDADGFERARDAAEMQRRGDAWEIIDDDIPFIQRPGESSYDVAAQLNTELIQLTVPEMPLSEMLEFLSQLGAVPISLHASALQVEGVRLDRPVSLEFEGGALGDALRQVLQPLGLTHLPMVKSVRVLPADSLGGAFEVTYEVGDLLPGFEKDSDDVIALVTALVHPVTWAEQGGSGTIRLDGTKLIVKQSYDVHQDIDRLILGLRQARKLTGPDPSKPSPLITRFGQAESTLSEPLSVQMYQPQPLSQIVDKLNAKANIQVVVDWESLANEGWYRDTELPLVSEDADLRQALRILAGSLEAAYRIEGDRVFTLTSRSRYSNAKDIEFYDCSTILSQDVSIDQLSQRVLSVFGGDLGETGQNRFYYDDESQYIIARMNQGEHKALLKFLNSWARIAGRDGE